MPSLPRCYILEDHSTFHVTWQCHNQDWLLQEDWAKDLYYRLLLKYKDRYGVQIYSYCFMDNHPHIAGKISGLSSFSDFWRVVNSCFARALNRRYQRRGQVVMDRFKSPNIQTEADLLKVMFYIDLNPKRAAKVKHPKQNRYSSYRYYAYGEADPLITPAPSYLALASTPMERQQNYQALVQEILRNDWKEKNLTRVSTLLGIPIGSSLKPSSFIKYAECGTQLGRSAIKKDLAESLTVDFSKVSRSNGVFKKAGGRDLTFLNDELLITPD